MSVDYASAVIDWPGGTVTILELTKQIIGMDPNDFTRDAELSMYITAAAQSAESYIDNKIAAQLVVEKYARSKSPVDLRYYPATDITEVMIDGQDRTDDFEIFESEGLVWTANGRCYSKQNLCFDQMTIAYTAGYDPIPTNLGYVIALTASNFEAGSVTSGAVESESIVGVGTIKYTTSTDEDNTGSVGPISGPSVSILNFYKRMYA